MGRINSFILKFTCFLLWDLMIIPMVYLFCTGTITLIPGSKLQFFRREGILYVYFLNGGVNNTTSIKCIR
ncbi:hypothetical protein JCM12298_24090 [Desulfothermus naphthae]